MRSFGLWLSVSIVLAGGSSAAAGATTYALTDLGTLGGAQSAALGVNDAGQVVGWSMDAAGRTHAFVWQAGQMTDLHLEQGIVADGRSMATAINATGQIVGGASFASNYHAALWHNGGVSDLDGNTSTYGGAQSLAYGINNAGHVVGIRDAAFNGTQIWESGEAFSWGIPGATISVPSEDPSLPPVLFPLELPGSSLSPNGMRMVWGYRNTYGAAYAINDADQVAGYSGVEMRAAWHDANDIVVADPVSDQFGGASQAADINDLGHVVGTAYGTSWSGISTGVLWADGQTLILDMATATGLNNQGQIIGHNWGSVSYLVDGGVTFDLSSLVQGGGFAGQALAISDTGMIVGQLSNGRAFLLTPVPEASSQLMMGLGLLGLVAVFARKPRVPMGSH